ncbi:MAG: carboxypeptidase regulatory-like domain-containing protein [Acidobacteria bacterium]|nr:carboxypeptidase regulatory-like domain-containing protein [Acidobacteriota bacterium]
MSRLAISLILAALAANAQISSTSPARAYRISGTVVNASTGQVLSKMAVSVGPAEGGSATTVTSAEDGHFTFGKLKPGKYWLEAQGHGFSQQRFDQHEEFSTAIAVGPGLDSEHLVFRLRPDARITGTITDDGNEPVAQANVMLFRTGVEAGVNTTQTRGQTNTDDQGSYHFGHIAPGNYYIAVSGRPWYAQNQAQVQGSIGKIAASAEEMGREFDVTYPVTYYPGVTDPAAATPLVVKQGDRVEANIELTAVPALHVRIRASGVDPSQGVGMNAMQQLFGNASVAVPMTFNVIGPGEFELSGVPPGEFRLSLQTWGKNPSAREQEINLSDDSEIDAPSGSTFASVTGVVQLESGRAVTGPASVQLLNRSTNERLSAQISAKGEFAFNTNQVRPGQYQVSVGGVAQSLVKSLSSSGATATGHEVDIGPAASVQLKITLSEGVGRVDGTALRDGQPSSGAMIVLVPDDLEHDSELIRRDQSDSDGTFTLYNVLPGKYRVVAIQNGWDLPWLSPGIFAPYLKAGEVVRVEPREKYNIKVNAQ